MQPDPNLRELYVKRQHKGCLSINVMSGTNAVAGPSRLPIKPRRPFVSAEHRPEVADGRFRVVMISSGSVASVKIPDIVGGLSKVSVEHQVWP
jgi:hypothetical protein